MKIIDLTDEHRDLFCLCLEDWSETARESGPKRSQWLDRAAGHAPVAKLALVNDGTVGGMIQYLPIEHSFAMGEDLFMILCIWVHGYPEGRGNLQNKGLGQALLNAAEEDARGRGARGMAAWGLALPFWMQASWFEKHGYQAADRREMSVLVWKPFTENARPPRWLPVTDKKPEQIPGKVTVTALVNGWCMGRNLVYERARRAALEFGDQVFFREIDAFPPEIMAEWGVSDEVFIDGRPVQEGQPPSFEDIRAMIEKRVALL